MWVVKLGGSLCASAALGPWLARLAAPRLVIVPGGGPFADAVRAVQARLRFSDPVAHRMALLAMAQYGCLLAERAGGALEVAESLRALDAHAVGRNACIWLPAATDAAAMAALPADWSVSADSIALWLAGRLGASGLLLVKSAPPPASPGTTGWAQAGYVDAHFPALRAASATPVYWLRDGEHASFDDAWRAAPPAARRVTGP